MKDELYILWTNENMITTEKMVLLYGHNAKRKGWWDEVTIIVWGAPSKLAAENSNVQEKIKEMISDGVRFIACKSCADSLGVSEALASLGIEVFYTGETLTQILKDKKHLLTV
jgi:hypothetical protein